MWRREDPQSNESSKIKWEIVPYTRGRGLDIGCGKFKTFPHFTGVDNGHHWGIEGIDVVSEADDLSMFASQSMDFVFSSHVLEHLHDTEKTLTEWWRVIKPGGHLVLYLPHKDLYPNIGQPGANPDHKHDFLPEDIVAHMEKLGSWSLVLNEVRDHDNGPGQHGNEYSFFQVYRKIQKKNKRLWEYKDPKPKKTACVVRYGGFGDMIQTSICLPGLKAQGYHVTVMTTPRGADILKADPNVDEFIIQDSDQVPNAELGQYWNYWKNKFNKFVNLSMSVEGSLLMLPGDFRNLWPKNIVNQMLDKNYMEMTAGIADVPFKAEDQRFYPTAEEMNWSRHELSPIINKQIIMWALAGSSAHKVSPYVDFVIARMLVTYPDVHFILVGDHSCKYLEGNSWDNEPRVWCRSGEYSIRQTLALAEEVNLIVGPETGVLNSAGMRDVAKIVLLSHSSNENLSKHWKNTTVLTPKNTPCHPCHKMHYGPGTCPTRTIEMNGDKLDGVACALDIDHKEIYMAIRDTIRFSEVAA